MSRQPAMRRRRQRHTPAPRRPAPSAATAAVSGPDPAQGSPVCTEVAPGTAEPAAAVAGATAGAGDVFTAVGAAPPEPLPVPPTGTETVSVAEWPPDATVDEPPQLTSWYPLGGVAVIVYWPAATLVVCRGLGMDGRVCGPVAARVPPETSLVVGEVPPGQR